MPVAASAAKVSMVWHDVVREKVSVGGVDAEPQMFDSGIYGEKRAWLRSRIETRSSSVEGHSVSAEWKAGYMPRRACRIGRLNDGRQWRFLAGTVEKDSAATGR